MWSATRNTARSRALRPEIRTVKTPRRKETNYSVGLRGLLFPAVPVGVWASMTGAGTAPTAATGVGAGAASSAFAAGPPGANETSLPPVTGGGSQLFVMAAARRASGAPPTRAARAGSPRNASAAFSTLIPPTTSALSSSNCSAASGVSARSYERIAARTALTMAPRRTSRFLVPGAYRGSSSNNCWCRMRRYPGPCRGC